MRILKRSAASAAAVLLTLVGTFYAAPSRAWDLSAMPAATAAPEQTAPAPIEIAAPAPAITLEASPAAPQLPRSLAGLVAALAASAPRDVQEECLAGAVYFEAKGEPLKGQLSVAEVILNRARSGRFPATACGVVKQRGQFSFVRRGGFPPIARGSAAWRKAVAIAHVAIEDLADGAAPRALFFHARSVAPGWRGLTRVASVGNHVFYR
ncbi:MAG TPA: cell wall hydrolase [Allosphingosinicella sp.]|jgi:spore germination cell wall hydrolase CwlJ-like protein